MRRPLLFAALRSALGFAVLGAALAAGPAAAQPRQGTPPRGFSLSIIDELFDGEPTTEVNLAGPMLGMVADASREDDPDLAETIEDLTGVFVREYALSDARPGALDRIRQLGRTMEREGWQTMVRSREDDEETLILTHPQRGMVVVTLDQAEDEATFVEIRGQGSAQSLGRLGGRFMRGHGNGE
jgi:hypothetical protein